MQICNFKDLFEWSFECNFIDAEKPECELKIKFFVSISRTARDSHSKGSFLYFQDHYLSYWFF